jgi:cytochrome c556
MSAAFAHRKAHALLRSAVVALVVAFTASFSCGPTPKQRYEQEVAQASGPTLHAIESEHLRETMSELARLSLDRGPQESDTNAERQRRAEEVSKAATSMAAAAKRIPEVLDKVDLSEQHRQQFVELADRLHGEALELRRYADRKDLLEMENTLVKINQTCDSCHTAFRVLPVTNPKPGN